MNPFHQPTPEPPTGPNPELIQPPGPTLASLDAIEQRLIAPRQKQAQVMAKLDSLAVEARLTRTELETRVHAIESRLKPWLAIARKIDTSLETVAKGCRSVWGKITHT